MNENALGKIKEFFSVPEKPVTNQELIEFKKDDPEGYAEVRDGLLDGSMTY